MLAGTFVMSLAASAATVLTAKNGMTVYVFDKDEGGKPTCYDACGQKWPAYLAESGGRWKRAGPSGSGKTDACNRPMTASLSTSMPATRRKATRPAIGIGGIWHIVSE
jgi:Secreted repeat of unknown function